MKLMKPIWVTHEADHPIFSIDIHPDGKRFATGGQGGDSGKVVIWNMEPVINETIQLNKNVPKMLCQLDNHLACVNCVRWSSNGLLASGGDDKVVMIWRLAGNSGMGCGTNSIFGGKAGVENWRCIATLRCHEGDVLDLAWAPHNLWLASASVDNSVIIWDASKFPAIVAILKGHTGLVKGVTWDPVGKYLASQSDDKTLRVWRTTDWGEATLISEPFDECGGTTHVLRLSWSPDGQYLVSAHAMNGGGPTAQIIEREGWTRDKDFVGHRKAITCVRFSGNILQKTPRGSLKPQQYCCVAIGSRDRSLSVWLTSLTRPLVVIHDLFTHSVLDTSWSPCGLRLAACSWDGTVAFIEFSQQELGQPLDPAEQVTTYYLMKQPTLVNSKFKLSQCILHERLYGKSLIQGGGCTVMESPALLNIKPSTTQSSNTIFTTTPTTITKTITSTTTPITTTTNTTNATSTVTTTTATTTTTTSSVITTTTTTTTSPTAPTTTINTSTLLSNGLSTSSTLIKGPINKQIETKTSDGRRRITPMFIPPPPDTSNTEKTESFSSVKNTSIFFSTSQIKSSIVIEKRDDVVVTPNVSTTINSSTNASSPNVPTLKKRDPSMLKAHQNHHDKRPKIVFEKTEKHVFPALKPMTSISQQAAHYAVTMTNNKNLAHLQVFRGTDSEPTWDVYLGYNAVALAASAAVIAVGLEDGSIHTFDPVKGSRPSPPLAPPAPLAKVHAVGNVVMIISCCGAIRVWEIGNISRLIVSTSASHLAAIGGSLLTCNLYNGMPHLGFTNAKAYVYNKEMGTWILIGDSHDPIWRWSAQSASTVIGGRTPRGPLLTLQEGLNRVAGSMPNPRPPHSGSSIVSFFEQQLLASKALGSSQEYVHWFMALISFILTQDGLERKLRIILDDLMGPSHSLASKSTSWDPMILGIKKHKLLSDALSIIGGHLRWQRLYLEYSEQLTSLNN